MKYTFEFKLKAVKHYLETGAFVFPPGCDSQKKRNHFRNHVRFWKSKYITMGEDGLRHKENNDVYSPERKLQIIGPILRMEISFTRQSKLLGIYKGTLSTWVKKYKLLGMDGLKCSRCGRPPKNMPEKKETQAEAESAANTGKSDDVRQLQEQIAQLQQRNRELEHRELLAQAEIDYLKKLHALAEKKRRPEIRRRRKPSASSAKAKDTGES